MDQMKIASAGAKAVIDPHGGRVVSLEIDGLEVLTTAGSSPDGWGLVPTIPWCGPLDGGCLDYADHEYDFPLTGELHAHNGLAHDRRWPVAHCADSVVKLSTRLGERWVFGGLVRQRIELTDEALLVEVQIEAEDYALPIMAGWLTWFRRRLDVGGEADLHLTPSARHELDDQGIPTGRRAAIGPRPWNDWMTGSAAAPVIAWPDALEVTVDSGFDQWRVVTTAEHELCLGPVSGPPNQLNTQPIIVPPGGRFSGWMSITWA
jgi:galactose mutarotase-like enzyme